MNQNYSRQIFRAIVPHRSQPLPACLRFYETIIARSKNPKEILASLICTEPYGQSQVGRSGFTSKTEMIQTSVQIAQNYRL